MRAIQSVLAISAFLLFSLAARGQQVVNAGGGTITGSSGSHSFSIGEIVITTVSDGDRHLTQGFLQPELPKGPDRFDYYPNPVADDLFLVNAEKVQSVRVYDLSGREVLRANYMNGKPIPLQLLSGASYLINTYDAAGKILHKFTIIKQ